ncbi:MAG: 16S rRNA (uracil(1498)-N(3))-methyltransferase [Acidobacteriota bacterium]|nr:16S rRNA (uracil(1498)-N(3))-methyltransferase [Acidobacteriota bacterium]
MARRRFFVDRVNAGEAELSGEEASHLTRVLRVEPGQRFELTDNQNLYLAEIAEVRKDCVRFVILSPLDPGPALPSLVLFIALIKFDRFEWLIEKATELGVERIVPVEAARSEPGLLAAAAKRVERWRKIARESSQQSRRVRMPLIDEARKLRQALGEAPGAHRFRLEERRPGAPPLIAASREASDYALLCGPEGGWLDSERDEAAAAGWMPVSLGPTILRAETAAIAATAVLVHVWNTALGASSDYTER